jgi:uncharacterized protein (DUF58 family)
MTRQKVHASKVLLIALLVVAIIGGGLPLAAALSSNETLQQLSTQLPLWALSLLLLLALADYLLARRLPAITLQRKVSGSAAVNKWTRVSLVIRHNLSYFHFGLLPQRYPLQIEVFDQVPGEAELQDLPAQVTLQPGQTSQLNYELRPLQRGPLCIHGSHLRIPSPLRFWQVLYRDTESSSIKVYPDFAAIAAYTLLATDNHTSQLGIKKKPRRGEGLEFHQLREYRKGDSLRQIDWKATSRRRQLISKEYQDERDQQILLLVDSGRRMRAKDDTLSHFDHSLNALLLVSYIALRQGDSVGVHSFGAANRWVPAQKGAGNVTTILNELYDLQAGNCASDYIAAAERLISVQRKRSLVILITNTRDEEVDELLTALTLLKKRHLVLLANIREQALDDIQQKPVENFEQALQHSGTNLYLETRRKTQERIASQGIYTIDCTPQQLPVRVANSYLEIKRTGLL